MALKTQASAALRLAAKRKQLSRSAPGLMHVRTHSTSSAVSPATMANVLNLAGNLKSAADVESLVLTYGVKNAHIPGTVRPLAVVKVGGEVITKDIDNLVTSLKFLKDFGLFPVVVHGGGPQLNDELAKAGVKPEYIGGGYSTIFSALIPIPILAFEPRAVTANDAVEHNCIFSRQKRNIKLIRGRIWPHSTCVAFCINRACRGMRFFALPLGIAGVYADCPCGSIRWPATGSDVAASIRPPAKPQDTA